MQKTGIVDLSTFCVGQVLQGPHRRGDRDGPSEAESISSQNSEIVIKSATERMY